LVESVVLDLAALATDLGRGGGTVRRRFPRTMLELVQGGAGALAIEGRRGSVVLPVGWAVDAAGLFGALPAAVLELAGAEADARVALTVDHASWWRARNMVGAMAQGTAGVFVLDRLDSGARSAETRVLLAGVHPDGAALIRIEPRRLVWWRGWSSGTVAAS